jgi:hypothetical protein
MTIEELVLHATDNEGFPQRGEVIVEMPDDRSRYATVAVRYNESTEELIVTIA